MLRIRLRRIGKKHQPHYRIVVAEHTAPVTGKYVSVVGHYNPRSKELVVDDAAVTTWLDNGAQPSNTIAKLLTKKGIKHKSIKIHLYPERPGKNVKPEAAEPAKAPESAEVAAEETTTEEVVNEAVAETTPTEEIVPATETDLPTETTDTVTPTETQKE
jgi:small subunit ribosomal protein S16